MSFDLMQKRYTLERYYVDNETNKNKVLKFELQKYSSKSKHPF